MNGVSYKGAIRTGHIFTLQSESINKYVNPMV